MRCEKPSRISFRRDSTCTILQAGKNLGYIFHTSTFCLSWTYVCKYLKTLHITVYRKQLYLKREMNYPNVYRHQWKRCSNNSVAQKLSKRRLRYASTYTLHWLHTACLKINGRHIMKFMPNGISRLRMRSVFCPITTRPWWKRLHVFIRSWDMVKSKRIIKIYWNG